MTPSPVSSTLSITPDQTFWNDNQIAALRQLDVTAGRADLELFFHQCKRTGLDPFTKQIYMLGRKSKNQQTQQWGLKWTIQTGIDGYRALAARAAATAGESYGVPIKVWCGEDGVWADVWLGKKPPSAAKVVVVKEGGFEFPAVARFDEYGQYDREGNATGMWKKMASNQLAKCAEALALRMAYPDDLSGIYVAEEMEQAEHEDAPVTDAPAAAAEGTPSGRDWLAELEQVTALDGLNELWLAIAAAGEGTDELAHALTERAEELRPAAEADQTPKPATRGNLSAVAG